MTQAYIEGFCKTAEDYGVDPEVLYKYAKGLGPVAGFTRTIFEPITRGVRGIKSFFTKKPSASKTLGSYAARARSGAAPSNEEATAALDKVLSEYFGGKVPSGLRSSIIQPLKG